MSSSTNIHKRIFAIKNEDDFNEMALEIFRYQMLHCPIYKAFCAYLKISSENVVSFKDIPFLPIEFFRTHSVISDEKQAAIVFESSGTGGTISSQHFVADTALYKESFVSGFTHFYGAPEDWHILALLPSYIEKGNSSLVYMVDKLMQLSGSNENAFYLHDTERLAERLTTLNKDTQRKTMLIGVSYALLDFAAAYPQSLENIVILETGGMKGRRKEIIKAALHEILCTSFQVAAIHSEYGMTELLSQAYSKAKGIFDTVPWMKVLVSDIYDRTNLLGIDQQGIINIIDLANIYSCSFISTSDVGRVFADGSFEISGRIDHTALRGCNLMLD